MSGEQHSAENGLPPARVAELRQRERNLSRIAANDADRDETPDTIGSPYHHEDERECFYRADGSGWWPWRFEDGVLNRSGGTFCLRLHPEPTHPLSARSERLMTDDFTRTVRRMVAENDVPRQREGSVAVVTLTTDLAVEAVAWERAPRYPSRFVNRRIVCADSFTVSVQASSSHYASDSSGGRAPYWGDAEPAYPFTTFEVGNPSDDPTPAEVWDEYESGGVWAWVPRRVVADLLDAHGGAVAWEHDESPASQPEG